MLLPYIVVRMFRFENNKEWDIERAMGETLRSDLDALARMEGTSIDILVERLVERILKLYVRDKYYKKARELLNFEDGLGTAVLLELKPQLEMLKKDINELKNLLRKSAWLTGGFYAM